VRLAFWYKFFRLYENGKVESFMKAIACGILRRKTFIEPGRKRK
jgi:hypothetical protein